MSSQPATYISQALPYQGPRFQSTGLFKRKWLYHTVFWILYTLFIGTLFYSIYQLSDLRFYLVMLLFFPCEMVLVYCNLYLFMPRLLFARKYLLYAAVLLFCFIIVASINTLIHRLNVQLGVGYYASGGVFNFSNLFSRLFELFSLTCVTTCLKLAKDWMLHLQWIQEKEKQYLETELNFLKSQIQPHFFFNTLNNLYSLTLKKSDLAPEVVLKLSDLMSYMLYESNAHQTLLTKEINYLQNYIAVEKLRFGQRLQVQFDTAGSTDHVYIPPMLLILFVENSFKHGAKHIATNINIHLVLKIEGGHLFFSISNPLPVQPLTQNQVGIGLKNVRRRLELLYGTSYTLEMQEDNNTYTVSLKIPVWK
jgi:two-component system, LytTR family, sensor kinase